MSAAPQPNDDDDDDDDDDDPSFMSNFTSQRAKI